MWIFLWKAISQSDMKREGLIVERNPVCHRVEWMSYNETEGQSEWGHKNFVLLSRLRSGPRLSLLMTTITKTQCKIWRPRWLYELESNTTHQSMFVWYVVGKFQFMKTDNFLHPLLPSGGTVRVDVHPLRHLGVRLPRHDPPAENRNGVYFNFVSHLWKGWLLVQPCQWLVLFVCLMRDLL